MDIASLQRRIDRMAYPPTMQYSLRDGLATGLAYPIGPLADRVASINRVTREVGGFFSNHSSLLDVGCNKGFFSLNAGWLGSPVHGIDISKDCVDLCRDLFKEYRLNGAFWAQGFRDWIPPRRYEAVFFGNSHHYVFKECGGTWDWMAKLAAIVEPGGLVLIEGPFSMCCADMAPVLPRPEDRLRFTPSGFRNEAYNYFEPVAEGKAIHYTPDRSIVLLRRSRRGRCDVDLSSLDLTRPIRVESGRTRVFDAGDEVIAKVTGPLSVREQIRIDISSSSPFSNGMLGFIRDQEDIVGWIEPRLDGAPLKYYERDEQVLTLWALHNLFCLHNGFFDEDPGTINWMVDQIQPGVAGLTYFDKNSLIPVQRITTESMGRTMKCFRQSFRRDDVARSLERELLWCSQGIGDDNARLTRLFTDIATRTS